MTPSPTRRDVESRRDITSNWSQRLLNHHLQPGLGQERIWSIDSVLAGCTDIRRYLEQVLYKGCSLLLVNPYVFDVVQKGAYPLC